MTFPRMTSTGVTMSLSCSLAASISCRDIEKPFLPATSSGERWIYISAQPSRPHKGGTAGLEARWVLWLTVLIISVMGAGNGKVRSKQLFRKCHQQRLSLRWYCLQQMRDRKDRESNNCRKERERTGENVHRGLARNVLGEDKSLSSSCFMTVEYPLCRSKTKPGWWQSWVNHLI